MTSRSRHRFQLKMVKLLLFNENTGKIMGFVIVYKLYIRIRIRKKTVKEQV